MPYKIFMENDKHCVYKLDDAGERTGSSLGCHDDEEKGKSQIAALNMNENKEDKTKMYDGNMVNETYYPVTSFSELEAAEEAEGLMMKIRRYASMFPDMVMGILKREDIPDKAGAISNLTTEFTERVNTLKNKEVEVEQNEDNVELKEQVSDNDNFLIWKEDGIYKWLAVYSNNIIDKEAEIISSESHRNFVDLVDKGLAPLPELWLWHRPEWKFGQATQVAYDNSGFALATGTVDKGCEPIAEWLSTKQLAVSHGMPPNSIVRDKDSPLIINRHITREISPLPKGREANKYTGFAILKEGNLMAIPNEKREALLQEGLSEETLKMLEERNQTTQKEVQEVGLQTKEEDDSQKEESDHPEYVTAEDVAQALGKTINPLVEVIKQQAQNIELISKEVLALKKADEEKIKQQAELTPKSSLEALLQKEVPSLFSKEAEVKEGEDLQSAVKETPYQKNSGLFFKQWAAMDARRGQKNANQ